MTKKVIDAILLDRRLGRDVAALDILLYEWWPIRRKRFDLVRLRDMPIEVVVHAAAQGGEAAPVVA